MECEQIQIRDQISIAIIDADQRSIDIIDDNNLVNSIRNKMESISYLHCICKVKDHLRDRNNDKVYIPTHVSIGPYHHEREGLEINEDQKWLYVHALISRKPNLEASLNDCITALKEVEHRARSCYSGGINDDDWPSNKFITMMLVDGCFIIELLLKYSIRSLRRRNDKIFTTPWKLFDIRSNLILLENQIPLFILQRLFQVLPIPIQCNYSFAELCFRFFKNMIPGDPKINREKFNQEAHHILDIICHCLLPTCQRVLMSPRESNSDVKTTLPSATELRSKGIRIKKARTQNLLDIRFHDGVLEIPPVLIDQYNEVVLENLIALEQCSCAEHIQHITSYAFFIKWLSREDEDVKLLKKRGILANDDEFDGRIAKKMFDKLDEANFNMKEFYHEGIRAEINAYVGTRKNKSRPVLRLAILALVIALLGTLFSILFSLHIFKKS